MLGVLCYGGEKRVIAEGGYLTPLPIPHIVQILAGTLITMGPQLLQMIA